MIGEEVIGEEVYSKNISLIYCQLPAQIILEEVQFKTYETLKFNVDYSL